MIYLTTGANGAGKTLLTLKNVREQQLKENRPVYYHGFDMNPDKAAEFGWQPFDPKKWQDLPDGSICIMDECQNEFPLRRSGAEVPDYVNAIAQHRRRRGFDFWMICPHPSLLDVFIRRLIDKPSWHRHIKRAFGADVVSVITFSSPDMKCEEPGAGARGEVTMKPYPKDVFTWYRSASLHTAKKKIPKAVYVFVAAALLVPLLLYYAISGVYNNVDKSEKDNDKPGILKSGFPVLDSQNKSRKEKPLTAAEYIEMREARIPDFPHTAPAYDKVTEPKSAPYPAACVYMGTKCRCYTQQATIMQVTPETCIQIVRNGFFMEWLDQERQPASTSAADRLASSAPMPIHVPAPDLASLVRPVQPPPGVVVQHQALPPPGWAERLEARNASVRSNLSR